jgi:hypothetical protein
MKHVWYLRPSRLTNRWWPPIWVGGDEQGRWTIVIQPPGLGALVLAISRPCPECMAAAARGESHEHDEL